MTQILIEGRPWKLKRLIGRLQDCSPIKKVICGPGYLVPTKSFYPSRFMSNGVHLGFGCSSRDHHPHLRPKAHLVPEITVEEYIAFLQTIAGQEMEGWKGDHYRFTNDYYCYLGLPGEVGLGVYGVHEGTDVTIMSAYD